MLTELEDKVAGFIKANDCFGSVDKVLLAVSGGADSTALLYAMCALKAEGVLSADFVCAHINHQLRGTDADLDEDFVVAQAVELRLAIITKRLDVRRFARRNKLSIETAARKLRMEGLLDIAKQNNCSRIATAHQKNDNAETVLQRLVRGTGFRGLGGIWPMRKFADNVCFVRPLLCASRDEIVEYLNERGLKWRQDHTNADCTYRRNFIRHRLIPALQQQCSGSIVEELFELSGSARRFYNLVCSRAEEVWPEVWGCGDNNLKLDLKTFSVQHPAVKVELVRRALARLGSGERDLTQGHFKRILQLAEQNVSGRKITLPGGFMVLRDYDKLVFTRVEKDLRLERKTSESVNIEVPGRTRFGRYSIEATILDAEFSILDSRRVSSIHYPVSSIERFDMDKLKLPLVVRFRKAGDSFWPLGLAGEKKVGKFLTAAKVPQELRRKLLIIADSEKIIWVWPIRISEQAKITTETQKTLQLQITDANLTHHPNC